MNSPVPIGSSRRDSLLLWFVLIMILRNMLAYTLIWSLTFISMIIITTMPIYIFIFHHSAYWEWSTNNSVIWYLGGSGFIDAKVMRNGKLTPMTIPFEAAIGNDGGVSQLIHFVLRETRRYYISFSHCSFNVIMTWIFANMKKIGCGSQWFTAFQQLNSRRLLCFVKFHFLPQ